MTTTILRGTTVLRDRLRRHRREGGRPGRLLRTVTALAVAAPAVALTAAAPASAGAAATPAAATCGIRWGSQARTAGTTSAAPVDDVRAGEHACYDRLVIDLAGAVGGYRVQYVRDVVADGSGEILPVAGGARLQVTVFDPAYGPGYHATFTPRDRAHVVPVGGYRTFRQVVWAGSFEGYTSLGLGVRARLPFRVFVLPGPGPHRRLVVYVAHRG